MMQRLEDKRVWLAGGLAAAVLIAATAWLVFIGPQLSSAKSLRADAATTRTQNAVLAAKVAKLKAENENVGELQATLRRVLAGLPYDTGLPEFTRQLTEQAAATKVSLTSIAVGSVVPTTASSSSTTSVMAIPVTLLSKGSGPAQAAFLKAMQVDGPRRSLVISTVLSSNSSSSSSSASIDTSTSMTTQLKVFTAPLSAAAKAQLLKLLAVK